VIRTAWFHSAEHLRESQPEANVGRRTAMTAAILAAVIA